MPSGTGTLWRVQQEPVIERADLPIWMGVLADINVNIARIADLLEQELGGDAGEAQA